MAFVELEDIGGGIEVTVFNRLYAHARDIFINDLPILVQGKLQKNEKSIKLVADSIVPIDKAEEEWTASIHITVDAGNSNQEMLKNLNRMLYKYPGNCPVFLHMIISKKTETIIALSDKMKVKAGTELAREITALLGYNAIHTHCQSISASSNNSNNHRKRFNGKKR